MGLRKVFCQWSASHSSMKTSSTTLKNASVTPVFTRCTFYYNLQSVSYFYNTDFQLGTWLHSGREYITLLTSCGHMAEFSSSTFLSHPAFSSVFPSDENGEGSWISFEHTEGIFLYAVEKDMQKGMGLWMNCEAETYLPSATGSLVNCASDSLDRSF